MFIKKLFILLFLLFNLVVYANEKQKITLYLDWLNQFQFAGYFIAKEKGYYDNIGLDVQIKEYSNNINVTNNVMTNEGTYGIGKSSLIIDKFDGKNIVLLSSIFQNSPLVLITLKSSNIKTPKDLKNKRVMITKDAKASASIKSMIVSQGVNIEDLEILEHSFNIDDLINGKTDAMACYLSNEPFILKNKDIEFNLINPHDYNFDFYEGILYTSQKELENYPIRVQNFNNASIKGWEYAFNNIEETAKLIFEKFNSQNKSLDSLIYEGNVLKNLSKIDKNLLGNIDAKVIDEIKRFYSLLGLSNIENNFDSNNILLNKNGFIFNEKQINYLNNNQFTLLVTEDKSPFSFKNTVGIVGIEVDFWNLISSKLSKPFNIEEIIQNRYFNIFTNSIKTKFVYGIENEEDEKYLLSNTIAQIPIAIATNNNKNFISDLSVLKDVTVGVLTEVDLLSLLKTNYPHINFIKINSSEEGFYRLKNNQIFGLIDNIFRLSNKMVEYQLDYLKINNTLNYKINMQLQVEKGDKEFIELINSAISIISDNEKNNILNNYQYILHHKDVDFIYIIKIIVPLIFLLTLFVYLNYKLRNEIKKREKSEIKLSNLANNDALTNIYNRRKIEEICEEELIRTKRYNNSFSIIFFDINDFKLINDLQGHHIGDEVLIDIADIISKNIRKTDHIGRWGGDEFLIILPQTNISQAKIMISTLEKVLENKKFNKDLKVTCSFGLSEYEKDDTLDTLLKKSDESMYQIKAEYKKRKKQIL